MAKPRKKKVEDIPVTERISALEPVTTGNNNADTAAPAIPDRDRIAHRAYELYIARGGADGRDLDDWLTAERELTVNGRRG